MILCVGEILVDVISKFGTENSVFAGGAPFNVACNAKFAGSNVRFFGKVGSDAYGKFLIDFANKHGFSACDITVDDERPTTVALVTLSENGEREFRFIRDNAADYNMEVSDVNLDCYNDVTIAHLGSLMLSEVKGQEFARQIAKKIKSMGIALSFDINFRTDVYESFECAITTNEWFVRNADILKFSEDEILEFTGAKNLKDAIDMLATPNNLIAVTLGSKGSLCAFHGEILSIPTSPVKAIDTTGAGDAFYGVVLSGIDKVGGLSQLNKEQIIKIFSYANKIGGYCATKKGAINPF